MKAAWLVIMLLTLVVCSEFHIFIINILYPLYVLCSVFCVVLCLFIVCADLN